jgi:glycosyltransferase XagB
MSEFPEPEGSGAWSLRAPCRARFPASLPASPANARPSAAELPVELAAFDGMVDPALLEAAALRAARLGVGGDEVLRCTGILTPDQIAEGIGAHLGIDIDPLNEALEPRSLAAACAGVLRQKGDDEEATITVAARGTGIRWLAERVAGNPRARALLRIAAPERLAEHVRSVAADELAQEAVFGLHAKRPDHSAIGYGWAQLQTFTLVLAAAMLAAGIFAPDGLFIAIEYFFAFSFIGWTLLRLAACLFPRQAKPKFEIADRDLPIYTIIVPLYREAPVVAKLVRALRQLRYPREKLDIKFMIETDDAETLAETAKLRLGAPFEIIAPPRIGPQTKPRALAAALPFARGSLVTVYDAEDEPEADQLRDAVAAFASGPPQLACVQAKLSIDNPDDGWFSRQFAAEYAGQFDVFLPALVKMKLPIPLGGTSNHFRTAALRHAGGWDPYNVTEDADLGMRLARYGYSIGVIDSTTWEEAPVGFTQWLRQRTRWFKGWTRLVNKSTYISNINYMVLMSLLFSPPSQLCRNS